MSKERSCRSSLTKIMRNGTTAPSVTSSAAALVIIRASRRANCSLRRGLRARHSRCNRSNIEVSSVFVTKQLALIIDWGAMAVPTASGTIEPVSNGVHPYAAAEDPGSNSRRCRGDCGRKAASVLLSQRVEGGPIAPPGFARYDGSSASVAAHPRPRRATLPARRYTPQPCAASLVT